MSTSKSSKKLDPLGEIKYSTKAIALKVELEITWGETTIVSSGVTE